MANTMMMRRRASSRPAGRDREVGPGRGREEEDEGGRGRRRSARSVNLGGQGQRRRPAAALTFSSSLITPFPLLPIKRPTVRGRSISSGAQLPRIPPPSDIGKPVGPSPQDKKHLLVPHHPSSPLLPPPHQTADGSGKVDFFRGPVAPDTAAEWHGETGGSQGPPQDKKRPWDTPWTMGAAGRKKKGERGAQEK